MFRITATRIKEEDRVEVDISKDDADVYEIGAVSMAVDEIVAKVLERGFGKLLVNDNEQEEEDESDD
jgi:hypothetical protein